MAASGPRWAFAGPNEVQEVGSISTGTVVSVVVTTTPALAYSTGSYRAGLFISTTSTYGQYMPERKRLEFKNQLSTDVWVGYDQKVSTDGVNQGWKLTPGQTLTDNGRVKDYWVVTASGVIIGGDAGRFVTKQSK